MLDNERINLGKNVDVTVVKRMPDDEFSYDLFLDLLSQMSDTEAYYIWTFCFYQFRNQEYKYNFTRPTVVFGFRDHLVFDEFNWWRDRTISLVEKYIEKVVTKNPDKNFIIFHSMENLEAEISYSNLHLIPWGGDWLRNAETYPREVKPVFNKNFNSTKTFISLNRNFRFHRLVTLSYLFGCGYDKYGVISYVGQKAMHINKSSNILDIIPWEFAENGRHDDIRTKILEGWKKVYNNESLILDDSVCDPANINSYEINNFNKYLRQKYENSFVEIVTETTFVPKSYFLTEKTLQSFYGCNFPIILGGYGIVRHLRDVGFDMYDDIIDHSYDTIANPFDRIVTAIESNRRLLLDSDYAKSSWAANRDRFAKNIEVAKTMYSWYRKRAVQTFTKAINDIKT